jgi:hypothetical protein
MLIATLAFLASALQPEPTRAPAACQAHVGPRATGEDAGEAARTGAAAASEAGTRPEGAPAPGQSVRLVGDASVKPTRLDSGEYRVPDLGLVIEAPLPAGYPAPTPPGMIELKTYPVVRRAEYSAKGSSNFGMNVGFWPLFNHIKEREIEMTSPVEMDYRPAGERTPLTPMKDAEGSWTMSFLYRTADLGPTGEDGRVKVLDNPEMTVVSIGMRGPYGMGAVNAGLEELQKWFAGQSDWEPVGDPRGLNYNGPQVRMRDKWSEVQVQVRRKAKAAAGAAPAGQSPAGSAPSGAVPAAPVAPSASAH